MQKTQPALLALFVTALLFPAANSQAITFTGDAQIGVYDTSFDGLDIVVSNCTLTVDGPHSFASLQILYGGVLTHTNPGSGSFPPPLYTVASEPHVLTATNLVALNHTNVIVSTILVSDLSGTVVYTNVQDYQVVITPAGATTVWLPPGSTIPEGSTNLVDYQYYGPTVPTGLSLTVSNNVLVEAGGSINVDGKGYGAGQGPGKGSSVGSPLSGGGAGHGGNGGYGAGLDGIGAVYENSQMPVDKGSGGGFGSGLGGAGGGAIKLVVGGALLVDGVISADGSDALNDRSGGGSGGSIWLVSQALAGSGVITANGGSGELPQGGGGGGGRISIQAAINVFSGQTSAAGGNGYAYGGAGTIYTQTDGQPGQLLVDNGGHSGLTTLVSNSPAVNLTAQGGAVLSMPGFQTIGSLVLHSNSWLMASNSVSTLVTVTGNATIDVGAGIFADGMGSPANQGRGAGRSYSYPVFTGGGGGYGGNGARGGGLTAYGGTGYGSLTSPTDFGSGGANYVSPGFGSSGGGAIHFNVAGTLVINGRISANGTAGLGDGSGGGSGGSVWVNAGTLAGAGLISANGGNGSGIGLYAGGGGGGGRISIQSGFNLFFGTTSARGGGGVAWGGAGTIHTSGFNQTSPQLLVDNGGAGGTNTTVTLFTSPTVDLTVQGGAVLTLAGQPYFGNLLIASNSWLVVSNTTVNAVGNVTVQAGGGIIADGGGYPGASGPGAGKYLTLTTGGYTGGGGGYGGAGGDGAGNTTATTRTGGTVYGSVTSPVDRGSGGGGPYVESNSGGAGGGALHLTVSGILDVDGLLTANGIRGVTPGGGGGSGGSLWLSVGTLTGLGTISANGGDGNGVGGGGGGGRIAIQYGANGFSGVLAARGGNGTNAGGAGTIYTKANSQANGQLVIDNGGQTATNTTWSTSPGVVDITVTGGAVAAPPYSQTIGNLLVGPGSALLVSNQLLTIIGNATIQTGGAILADGTGFGPGQGQGAGRPGDTQIGSASGGGGYGGNGGNGASASPTGGTSGAGGNTYGSLTAPTDLGSGGGSISIYGSAGAGGGAVRLNVSGALTVSGRISANGGSGAAVGSAGGSGGSIWLTVGMLSGSGLISANGGSGGGLSGGGGGGRISILSGSNVFAGSITAFGGAGNSWGGAGTIYLGNSSAPGRPPTQVIVDNGGQLGTNTAWPFSGVFDLTIRGGGIVAPPPNQVFNNLVIASNSWLFLTNQSITVNSNATVQAGGGIIADGTGYIGSQGPGSGRYVNLSPYGYIGGGGGHGGYGAVGAFSSQAYGGATYGSLLTPTDRGSSGGFNPGNFGGGGGGAIRLNILGSLYLNGRLSANGSPGGAPGAGGGSGGSIWVTVGTLAGSGGISANGGDGNSLGGGGGGGRVALQFATNAFMGPITAFGGGGGTTWGGAGTIYLKPSKQTMGQLLVDNGGRYGTNTVLSSQFAPFDLTVRNGAGVLVNSASLLLSNLDIGPGGLLSFASSPTNMMLTVLRDALVETSGVLTLDGKGYAGMAGPGRGSTTNTIGSGGGYGGKGGASSLQSGGPAYGSAVQPVDAGSSGGFGYGTWTGGSEGGGALRLSVGRLLTVNGLLTAGGNAGLQDDAGGGAGGSLWVSAAVIGGTGQILADGGVGELYRGGGGGGGRIAIYSPANLFGGTVLASGGGGFARGNDGTIYYSSALPPFQALAQSPVGTVTYAVSSVDVTFNSALDPFSALVSDAVLTTPAGTVSASDLTVTATSATGVRVSFPPQTAEGAYSLTFGSQLQNLYGQPLSQVYTGAFAITWPVIQGVVTDGSNQPVAGVVIQPDGGLAATQTDATGSYALKVLPSANVTIVPVLNNLVFVPRAQSYAAVTAPLALQNYLAVNSIVPTPSVQYQAGGMVMSWQSIPGVTYQAVYSTNLVDWLPYGDPVVGADGTNQLALPYDSNPQQFFRLRASN